MHSAPTTTADYPSKQPALHVMLESPALPHCTHYTCTHSDIPHHVHMYVWMYMSSPLSVETQGNPADKVNALAILSYASHTSSC